MSFLDLRLEKDQRDALRSALLKAFPGSALDPLFQEVLPARSRDELLQMSGEDKVYKLIVWAEEDGQVGVLLHLVECLKPGHNQLRGVITGLKPHRPALMWAVPSLEYRLSQVGAGSLPWSLLRDDSLFSIGSASLPLSQWSMLSERSRRIELLYGLADLPAPREQPPPLLQFVMRLMRHSELQGIAGELWDWLQNTAAEHKIPRERLQGFKQRLDAPDPSQPLFLLVKIDLWGNDRYTLGAWLVDAKGGDCGAPPFKVDEPMALPERGLSGHRDLLGHFKPILEDILATFESQIGSTKERLTVEFLLPRALLNEPFDQIPIEGDGITEIPLGVRYGVVVRSGDRLAEGVSPRLLNRWRSRWQAFQPTAPVAQPLVVCNPEEIRQPAFNLRMDDLRLCCLGLAIPQSSPAYEQEDFLHLCILKTGIPIALWVRGGANEGSPGAREELERLLGYLPTLPRQLWQEREALYRQGNIPPGHLRNHLTLLWDDPNRLPEEFQGSVDLKGPAPSR